MTRQRNWSGLRQGGGTTAAGEAGVQPAAEPLPLRAQPGACSSGRGDAAQQELSSPPSDCQRYLAYFKHRLLDFRLPELVVLSQLAGVPQPLRVERPAGVAATCSPFWYIWLPSDAVARTIVERSVLLRGVFELWGEGDSLEELEAAVAAFPAAAKVRHIGPDTPWRVMLDAFGFSWSSAERRQMLQQITPLLADIQGRIDLEHPATCLWLCCIDKRDHNGLPEVPRHYYFARQVAFAPQGVGVRYALTSRRYIGPTSMDPELAFIMANLAQVARGSLVLDPYVGTGSILVAAAACGAATVGGDIDPRVLRPGCQAPGQAAAAAAAGKGQAPPLPDLFSNFEQYGLPAPLGIVRMDVHTAPFREGLAEVFDAIIGDPPYGVRAGGRKLVANASLERRPNHVPATQPYSLTECLADLMELAARLLVQGGRLVYFMPATPDTYQEAELPRHPTLALLHNTEQPLNLRYSRRLLAYEKVKAYDAAEAAAFAAARAGFCMAIDKLPEQVSGELPLRGSKTKYRSKMT